MTPTDYDELAQGYDQRYRDRKYRGVEETLIRQFEQVRGAVIEVGCGTAQWVHALSSRGLCVLGFDASHAMLSVARERAEGRLAKADASALPLCSHACAGLYAVHAFHHFPDKALFVREVTRVLSPGARFVVISLDPHRREDHWVVYDYWPETYERDLARYASAQQLSEYAETTGLRLREYGIAEQLEETRSARELLERGDQLKRSTSQLADLSEKEWQEGLGRLRRAAEAAPGELMVRASLRLSFWAFER
jgi:ubiquinone/menaquinone biosynthesis C-methylase UbiE